MIDVGDGLVVLGLAVGEEGRGEDAPEGVDQRDRQEDDEQKSARIVIRFLISTDSLIMITIRFYYPPPHLLVVVPIQRCRNIPPMISICLSSSRHVSLILFTPLLSSPFVSVSIL